MKQECFRKAFMAAFLNVPDSNLPVSYPLRILWDSGWHTRSAKHNTSVLSERLTIILFAYTPQNTQVIINHKCGGQCIPRRNTLHGNFYHVWTRIARRAKQSITCQTFLIWNKNADCRRIASTYSIKEGWQLHLDYIDGTLSELFGENGQGWISKDVPDSFRHHRIEHNAALRGFMLRRILSSTCGYRSKECFCSAVKRASIFRNLNRACTFHVPDRWHPFHLVHWILCLSWSMNK